MTTNIDLKIETNVTTYDYAEFDMLIKSLYKTTNKQYDDTQTTEQIVHIITTTSIKGH